MYAIFYMPVIRIRKHVNPLSRVHQIRCDQLLPVEIYKKPMQPLHIDLGCGMGEFLLTLAKENVFWNYLGVDIRKPWIDHALSIRKQSSLPNLYYIHANLNVSLRSIFSSFPRNLIQRVSIQFPDPWPKQKHHKRRMVTDAFVKELALRLETPAQVFIQSDIEEVAKEILTIFQRHPAFALMGADLPLNPCGAPTAWEKTSQDRGQRIFRYLFGMVAD
ncbi:MAG: tRNA (guanosine(46)-N7)-methyltransferase TrmB [Deltaproteobacteria bacterium]|nr:tRNA (guanosine(46)-N7)-methyltransferase TrmB [Deltaproteobacteria bacterium]